MKPGLQLLEEVKGYGSTAEKGDMVEVKLNGWLNQGEKIQSDYVGKILLGSRAVIPGIEYAIEGMRIRGKRKVKISPHLGYKQLGVEGLIPPNALLIYAIEVLNINKRI